VQNGTLGIFVSKGMDKNYANISQDIATKRLAFTSKLAKKVIVGLVFVVVFDFILFPIPTLAAQAGVEEAGISLYSENLANIEEAAGTGINSKLPAEEAFANSLPGAEDLAVKTIGYHTVTAYNSLAGQTDASPCITANGFNLCEHGIEDSVAANWLPFGARIKLPDLYGDRVFVVRDRMNSKYNDRLDIWFKERADAKNFGVKYTKIEVLDH
jgi:3D (Asp-Asp-Asp) domain-containing protein